MKYDVAIIGASIAGSSLAAILGRSGLKIALFDKAKFPRTKPCGEGLSKAGIAIAVRNHLWSEEPPPIPCMRYEGFQLVCGKRSRFLSPRTGGGITIRRDLFDHYLLSLASTSSSVTTFLNTAVSPSPMDYTAASQPFKVGQICSRYLVLADGCNSPGARKLGIPSFTAGPDRVGASAHFVGRFLNVTRHVHIRIEEKYEVYATPLFGGYLNIAILANAKSGVNLIELLRSAEVQRRIFEALGFEGELLEPFAGRAPLGNLVRRSNIPRTFLIGDAAEGFDPIGGMGMTHAFLSAELAAQEILNAERDPRALDTAHLRYQVVREAAVGKIRTFTRLSYRLLRSAHHYPSLLSLATSKIGTYAAGAVVPR